MKIIPYQAEGQFDELPAWIRGEYKLIEAIILQASLDLHPTQAGDYSIDATEWLLSDSLDDWSFRWLCGIVETDYKILRDRILNGKHVWESQTSIAL